MEPGTLGGPATFPRGHFGLQAGWSTPDWRTVFGGSFNVSGTGCCKRGSPATHKPTVKCRLSFVDEHTPTAASSRCSRGGLGFWAVGPAGGVELFVIHPAFSPHVTSSVPGQPADLSGVGGNIPTFQRRKRKAREGQEARPWLANDGHKPSDPGLLLSAREGTISRETVPVLGGLAFLGWGRKLGPGQGTPDK